MTIQLLHEEPGVCQNPDCPDFQAFELYDADEIENDFDGEYYEFVICRGCGRPIVIE